ncbi:MAG: hypothetical protein JNK48_03480 [Bryobacterales bacterium]|nr:hypothetical protein [Bryobacterales bacterium]
MSDSQMLPYEPGSRSELLAARNVFSVEVLSLAPSEWKVDPSTGLQTRSLAIEARLLTVHKGLPQAAAPFRLAVPQRREDALTVSDFHGFWSHRDLEAPRSYLAFSNAPGNNPAAWMADEAMLDLIPATDATAAEIALALDVERRLAPVDSRDKVIELLKTLFAHREKTTGLFARYACARLAPQYEAFEEGMQTGIMRVVTAAGATGPLRETLVEFLYDQSAEQELTEDKAVKLAQRFIAWARQPEASPMLDRLIDVHLYNLIFRPDEPALPVAKVLPDAAERAALAAIFAKEPSPRCTEVISWLNGKR